MVQFLSTPSARRATGLIYNEWFRNQFLSTPSARRATLGNTAALSVTTIFLSTPSARRATPRPPWCRCSTADFYPRPPRGGRRTRWRKHAHKRRFLSTPSARRATLPQFLSLLPFSDFYPRPPRGGRPRVGRQNGHSKTISIHALREEGDP